MGVTIHYRGTMDDISEVETMENRILDLVFSLGGRATIWRSFADHDSTRVVRGLLIEMEPGQETFSLLVSPEGHLTPLFQIEDGKKGPFDEPPYCFVKTQFGSPQGHIAIVHLLDALRQRFCTNLEVTDEGEYYENRDVHQLHQKLKHLRSAISSIADGLGDHGLSAEAAEDPNILAKRIERVAALVQQKILADQDESKSFEREDDQPEAEWNEPSLEDEVETMDRLRRKNDLRSERMSRRITEATASGMSTEEAFKLAMEEEGLPTPDREADQQYDPTPSEPWMESLPSHSFGEANENLIPDEHPAIVQAQAFLIHVMNLEQDDSSPSSYISVLARAGMDIVGGLAQATNGELDDNISRALTITQLKRALSGHAYARGAIFGLRSEGAITKDQSDQLHEHLQSLLSTIHELAEKAWTTQ